MGKQAPSPSNYKGAAEASSQSSRPNVSTPFGFTNWSIGPNGQSTVRQGLGPEAQSVFNNLGPVPSGSEARQQAIDASFNDARRRLDPMFAQQQSALDQKLANQGLPPTSAAARAAQGNFTNMRNDAYSGALARAIEGGTQAGNALFQQNLISRNLPISDLQAQQGLMGGINYGQAADFLGAAMGQDAANLQQWLQSNKANADTAEGIMKLLAALAQAGATAASDSRLKQRIEPTGMEALPGVPLVRYEFISAPGVPQLGVLAQDLRKVAPHLVKEMQSGFLAVDYAGLHKEAEKWRS